MKLLKSSVRKTEQNSQVILEAINMILFNTGIELCIETEKVKSPVIEQAKENYKKKIVHFKQKKDNYRRKNKI